MAKRMTKWTSLPSATGGGQEDNMKTVQTGLRLPEAIYNQLKKTQEQCGVPINSQIVNLICIGLDTIRLGIQEQARTSSHSRQDSTE